MSPKVNYVLELNQAFSSHTFVEKESDTNGTVMFKRLVVRRGDSEGFLELGVVNNVLDYYALTNLTSDKAYTGNRDETGMLFKPGFTKSLQAYNFQQHLFEVLS